jgi:hypothetical protein
MNKFISSLAALVLIFSPVAAAPWSEAPCSIVMADKYGAYVPNGAADYLASLPLAEKFGSTCNMNSYIAAECRLHPNGTVGAAIKRLLRKAISNKTLPYIPICGA